jgi:hypothetical protein
MYEIQRGNMDAAKGLFYQGIRNCPWSKGTKNNTAMYMQAFKLQLETREYEQIKLMMEEKEIRTRF